MIPWCGIHGVNKSCQINSYFICVLYCLGYQGALWIDSSIYNFRKILCFRIFISLALVPAVLSYGKTCENTLWWVNHSERLKKDTSCIPKLLRFIRKNKYLGIRLADWNASSECYTSMTFGHKTFKLPEVHYYCL